MTDYEDFWCDIDESLDPDQDHIRVSASPVGNWIHFRIGKHLVELTHEDAMKLSAYVRKLVAADCWGDRRK